MKRLKRDAILLSLVEALRHHGSWCGEKHIQKATYFLQELLGVPLEFEFILYKHGPFSFDLRDEITAMRADEILQYKPQPYPYGPSLVPGDGSSLVKEFFDENIKKYEFQVNFIAKKFGDKGVSELERIATALYVTLNPDGNENKYRANKVVELKSHISIESAQLAIQSVDEIIEEKKNMVC
jgi:hypothetical protein